MEYHEKIKYIEENFGKYKNIEYFYRFWEKVDIKENSVCWNWLAGTNDEGYGYFSINIGPCQNKNLKSHRVTYMLSKGEISDNKIVMHKCNNPSCCNPIHLELGNKSRNTQYMVKCGRQNNIKGENNGYSKLTDDQVREIHKLYKEGLLKPGIKDWQITEPIARQFGIYRTTVKRIVKGEAWRHIYEEIR